LRRSEAEQASPTIDVFCSRNLNFSWTRKHSEIEWTQVGSFDRSLAVCPIAISRRLGANIDIHFRGLRNEDRLRRTHLPGPAPVRRTNLTQLILDQLRDYVLGHGLLEEDRLPPERELAAQLDVSRPSLRNALDWLAQRGALRRVQGGGTFLQSTFLTVLAEAHIAAQTESPNVGDVAEARGYLEPLLVELAAERADDEELEALTADSARAGERLDDTEFWRQHDLAFHSRVAKLSGNAVLGESLIAALRQSAGSGPSTVAQFDSRNCHEQHAEIIAALARRDGENAARLMREHLQSCHGVAESATLRVSA